MLALSSVLHLAERPLVEGAAFALCVGRSNPGIAVTTVLTLQGRVDKLLTLNATQSPSGGHHLHFAADVQRA